MRRRIVLRLTRAVFSELDDKPTVALLDPTHHFPLANIPDQLLEPGLLFCDVLYVGDGSQGTFADRRPAKCFGHDQDVLLDLGSQTKHPHDLRDPDPADALPAGDIGLVFGLAGRQQRLPPEGLAEKLDNRGRSGHLGWLGFAPGRRDGANDPV